MMRQHSVAFWTRGASTREIANTPMDERPRLTPYLPAASVPTAAIVVCPGGGYRMLAPHEGEPVARWLNGLGIAAFVLEYRHAPHRHPAPLQDAQRAIRLVRHFAGEWNVAPDRVGILGFSAGGHLAATAGTQPGAGDPHADDPVERQSARPDLMVLCYPVITFVSERDSVSMANLIGEDAPDDLRRALSAELNVTPGTPPAFLWHTAEDAAVPVEDSLRFASALHRAGVRFALHVFPHGRHGLGLATDDPTVGQWTTLCARWLADQGFGARE
jgi:acetyl esterase/lipase